MVETLLRVRWASGSTEHVVRLRRSFLRPGSRVTTDAGIVRIREIEPGDLRPAVAFCDGESRGPVRRRGP